MLYDHRTYVCRPGTIAKQIDLYVEHGYAAQLRHIGRPALFAVTDIGNVNSYVHVWAYTNMEDRAVRRAAMLADPAWADYVKLSREAGYLVQQTSKFLRAVALPA